MDVCVGTDFVDLTREGVLHSMRIEVIVCGRLCQNPATVALSRTAAGTLFVLSWIAMRSSHVDLDRRVTLSWIAVGPLALS